MIDLIQIKILDIQLKGCKLNEWMQIEKEQIECMDINWMYKKWMKGYTFFEW